MHDELLYIVWTNSNNLGIPIIDEQHRGIVSTINSLHHFIKQGRGLQAILPTFIIMEQYSNLHFETEEDLLSKFEYPEYEKHALLHTVLKEKLRTLRGESFLNKDPELALKFLKEWWLNHINIEDRKYVKYIVK